MAFKKRKTAPPQRGVTPSRRSAAKRPSAPQAGDAAPKAAAKRPRTALVTLRVGRGATLATVAGTEHLVQLAAEWMYLLRNRSRWLGDADLKDAMRKRAVKALDSLGVKAPALRAIVAADSRHLELEFAFTKGTGTKPQHDAASSFPWEFVLSSATREAGRSLPLLITRLISAVPARASSTGDMLFVESAPGRLKAFYSFESERQRLQAAMGGSRWRASPSPTPDGLRTRVAQVGPKVIHVSGVDSHQMAQIVPGFYQEAHIAALVGAIPADGIIMRGAEIAELPVPHNELAASLTGTGTAPAPDLVTLNLYYSGARTARDCVQGGARAAIGFLDEVDDETAEYFFQTFYLQWRLASGTANAIPLAFGRTWYLLRERGSNLFGTGLVLWLARSAFAASANPVFRGANEEPEESQEARLPTEDERVACRLLPMEQVLQVDLDVPSEINYSLLHNSRRFLETLTLTKLRDHPLDEIKVEVQLNAGDGSLPFRHTEVLLSQPQRALADDIRLPLTAALLRSPRERVQSTLYVRVMWDKRVALEQTRAVTLLPVDEWFDDTQKNPWLPSFVLPRDPAVARIISAARRHLVTLQDDPSAGFDGYQSTDVANKDCESVDEQVQALWTTLVQEFRLAYINPPPAYSERNQRLRTPSEVIASNSGTCIDLSLLLASCLEYVDIYPVVVLLSGHAFVGYWRAEEYHDEFAQLKHVPHATSIEVGAYSTTTPLSLVDPYGWRLAQQQYREVLEYVRRDKLKFLEATGLCFNYSYADAVEEGRGDIKAPGDFDSLLDIALARRASPPVTPLPMILADRAV